MATNDIVESSRPRTRPRGNTFGVAGTDSALRITTVSANEDTTFGYGNTLHNLQTKASGGRSRAESYASSTVSQISYTTQSFFGGGTSSGIGEAPIHSLHRDRASTYSGRGLSIYSTLREKERGDGGSMLSADWEKADQRASITSFLTFGRNRSTKRDSASPQRGRTGSPMLNLSGTQSPDLYTPPLSPLPRVVMPPIMDGTDRHLNPRRHLTPLTPVVGPGGQLTIATPPGTSGSATANAVSHILPFPSRTQNARRHGSFRSRSNTADSIIGGRGRRHQELGETIDEVESERVSITGSQHQSELTSLSSVQNDELYDGPGYGEDREERASVDQLVTEHTLSHSVSQPALASVRITHPYAIILPGEPTTPSHQHGHHHQEPHLPPHHQFLQLHPHAPIPRQATRVNLDDLDLGSTTHSLSLKAPMTLHHPYSQTDVIHNNTYLHETIGSSAIAASLGGKPSSSVRATKSSLRGSMSTPNLRSLFRRGSEKEKGEKLLKKAPKPKIQYVAETWCDALMFPRPRFRAHIISPPPSPTSPGQVLVERATGVQASSAMAAPASVPPRQSHFSFDTPPGSRKMSLKATPVSKSNQKPPPLPDSTPMDPTDQMEVALMAGEQRERERLEWNELARSSFQNRRSRSLSRPRKKSLTKPRDRVDSEASVGSKRGGTLTRSLTVGLANLAVEAFRQPAPTISSMRDSSHGHGTESGQSRNSRSTSDSRGRGHGRNTSWGKVALKKLCDPQGDRYDGMDENARKRAQLEDALKNDKTIRVSAKGRMGEEREKGPDMEPHSARVGQPKEEYTQDPYSLQPMIRRQSPQSQPSSNGADALDVPVIGIALSTPPPPSPGPVEVNVPDLSSHPYAQHARQDSYPGTAPISASYAGPHPTAKDYKPRFPIHRSKSPEAPNAPPPTRPMVVPLSDLSSGKPASLASSAVSPDRHSFGPNAYAYANANANRSRTSTLGVEEVLAGGFSLNRRNDSDNFIAGLEGDLDDMNTVPVHVDQAHEEAPPVPKVDPKYLEPMDDIAPRRDKGKEPEDAPQDLNVNHEVGIVEDTSPEFVRFARQNTGLSTSTVISSPSSLESSFAGLKPVGLGKMEDAEFGDLFFRPNHYSESLSLASERPGFLSRETTSSWFEDRIKSTDGLNGLSLRAMQLSDEIAALDNGMSNDSVAVNDADNDPVDASALSPEDDKTFDYEVASSTINIQESRLESQLLPDMEEPVETPTRDELVDEQEFPEDVGLAVSSRVSTATEHGDDTLRIGSVRLSTPVTTQSERRHSTAPSFGEMGPSPKRDTALTAQSTLSPIAPDDPRTSYLTTTSSTSHMETIINDFPAVPAFPDQIPPSRPDSAHVLGLNPPPQRHHH